MIKSDFVFDQLSFFNFTKLPPSDLSAVLRYRNHPQVRKFMRQQLPISARDHKIFIDRLKSSGVDKYWLVKKGDDSLGVVYLNQIYHQRAELGIYLNPAKQGQGLGSVLLRHLLTIGFHHYQLDQISLEVLINNIPAITLYQKFGFHEFPCQEPDQKPKMMSMLLTRDEWQQLA